MRRSFDIMPILRGRMQDLAPLGTAPGLTPFQMMRRMQDAPDAG